MNKKIDQDGNYKHAPKPEFIDSRSGYAPNVAPKELGFKLYNGFIMTQETKAEQKTEGGLYIPESALKPTDVFEVVAIADDVSLVSIGDKIIIDVFTSTKKVINGKIYTVCKSEDVLLKFDNVDEQLSFEIEEP